jgi:hypothetical protein
MDKFATKEELNVLIKSVDELKMNLEINVNELKKEINDNFNKILMILENNNNTNKTQELVSNSAEKEFKQTELTIDKSNMDKVYLDDNLNEEEDIEFNFNNIKSIDNVARLAEDIPCTKDMCGMFPLIIRMIHKSINAICSFSIAKYCVAAVTRVGKDNKNSGKIIDDILWCIINFLD